MDETLGWFRQRPGLLLPLLFFVLPFIHSLLQALFLVFLATLVSHANSFRTVTHDNSSARRACSNPEFRAVREIEIAPPLDDDRAGPGAGADRPTDRRTLATAGDRADHGADRGT